MWTDSSKEEPEKNETENKQGLLLTIYYFYEIKKKCQIYWGWKMAEQLTILSTLVENMVWFPAPTW